MKVIQYTHKIFIILKEQISLKKILPMKSYSISAKLNNGLTLFWKILGACRRPPYGLTKTKSFLGLLYPMKSDLVLIIVC